MVDANALGPGLEFDLIRRFLERSRTSGPHVLAGPGDDCAIITGGRIAVSADLSIEGVHFRRDWIDPEEIGYRAAAAALSDLAAMAAAPIGILTSLGIPESDVPDVAVRVMDGVREAADLMDAALLGGDVARSPGPLLIDVVVLGNTEHPVLRSGARPGDELWVTGVLGGAAAAVASWTAGETPEPSARAAFVRPKPRTREARWLAERGAMHALLDISDGLAGDAGHLATASGVKVVLDAESIPVHPAARRMDERDDPGSGLHLALTGGEDYELCFAAPAGAVDKYKEEFETTFDLQIHKVGTIGAGHGVWLRREDGTVEPLTEGAFRHFDGESK